MHASREDAKRVITLHGGGFHPNVKKTTHVLVVGMGGWPLLKDGTISRKLQKAESMQAGGQDMAIWSERRLWETLGEQPAAVAKQGQYTLAQAAEFLSVPASLVERCVQFGLLHAAHDRLDFQDLVGLRATVALLQQGLTAPQLARSLTDLSRLLPEVERPLNQLRLLARHNDIVAEFQGIRFEPSGQLVMDLDDSETAHPSVTTVRPDWDVFDWFHHGLQSEKREQWSQARQAYSEVIKKEPLWAEAHLRLGHLDSLDNDEQAAAVRYETASRCDPGWGLAWFKLGAVNQFLGRLEEAVIALEKAVALDTTGVDALFRLASCYEQLQRRRAARLCWQRLLEMQCGGEWAAIARAHLQNLNQSMGR